MKKLFVDNSLCSGCLSCVINCSQFHEGFALPEAARIRVNLEPFIGTHEITWCRQCDDAECMLQCPEEAIYLKPNGAFVVDYDKCVNCLICVEVCPYGAMFFLESQDKVIKCDLCGGDPQCVKSCFTGALWWGETLDERPDTMQSRYFYYREKENKHRK